MKRFYFDAALAVVRRAGHAALLVVFIAFAGHAEDAKPVRVGASHRVDVIAPGERVETAIDRMRRSAPLNLPPRLPERLAPRPPAERALTDRGAADRGTADRGSERGAAERGSDRPGAPEQQKQGASGTQGPQRR